MGYLWRPNFAQNRSPALVTRGHCMSVGGAVDSLKLSTGLEHAAWMRLSYMDIEIAMHKYCHHLLVLRNLSPNTVREYRTVISLYCRFAQPQTLTAVTEHNLREFFLHGRTQKNWSTNTFIGFYRALSVFFRWCVANNYLQTNPIVGIELPKLERRLPSKFSKQEALKLLEVVYNYPYKYKYLRYRNHAMFSMFVFAGLRKSELLKLRFVDVDITNLTIFVNQGKGRKDRIIPMSYTLAESLKRYVDERKRLGKTCPQFFASLNHNMGFTDTGMKRLVDKMRQATGMKFTVHKLRHTFATLMLEGGCDIYSLSKMMGHGDITTTTIYLSASAEHLRGQMSKHPLNDF